MIVVAIAGKFDPLHEGHIDHIRKAKALGDFLIGITHRDEIVTRVSEKGFCAKSLNERVAQLYANGVDLVVVSADEDGTVTKTLEILNPSIFAKGGDRTKDNMPQSELDICSRIGCRIVYGIGDLLNSSSTLVGSVKCRF